MWNRCWELQRQQSHPVPEPQRSRVALMGARASGLKGAACVFSSPASLMRRRYHQA